MLPHLLFRRAALLAGLASFTFGLQAAIYHVDPARGDMANPGTAAAPWSTLEAVFKSGQRFAPGDVIRLRSGYHGYAVVKGENTGDVTIEPQLGHHPKLRKLRIQTASHWVIRGLDISPLHAGAEAYDTTPHVEATAGTSHITIEDCRVRSAFSVEGWDEEAWRSRVGGGMVIRGPHATLSRNRLENVKHGIYILPTAEHAVVASNVVDAFRDDGLRGLASHCRFEYNRVQNAYDVTANHDDGFQSYSADEAGAIGRGIVRDVVLRGNVFIAYTDPAQPFKSPMQGIGCFDGMFEDWVVENNVVITDAWHGISFYGATNCRIVHNTVVKHPDDAFAQLPWIHLSPHKDGRESAGNIVRNNLASTIKVSAKRASLGGNMVTTDYATHFVDWAHLDLRLRAGSGAIDAAVATDAAPVVDADGGHRDGPLDVGAYEFGAGAPLSSAGRLGQLLIQGRSGEGEETLIVGVVVGGSGTSGGRSVLARAAGPALEPLGEAGFAADPRIDAFAAAATLASNDNWDGSPELLALFQRLGATAFGLGSKDAALHLADLAPGAYTLHVQDATRSAGVALVDLYDAGRDDETTTLTPRLLNVSVRAPVDDSSGLAVGFVVTGQLSRRVLIRAVGPTLAEYGLKQGLPDPAMALYQGAEKLQENNDWAGAAELAEAARVAGAFPLPAGSADAALVATLPPGPYVVQVAGSAGSRGIILVELYELP